MILEYTPLEEHSNKLHQYELNEAFGVEKANKLQFNWLSLVPTPNKTVNLENDLFEQSERKLLAQDNTGHYIPLDEMIELTRHAFPTEVSVAFVFRTVMLTFMSRASPRRDRFCQHHWRQMFVNRFENN